MRRYPFVLFLACCLLSLAAVCEAGVPRGQVRVTFLDVARKGDGGGSGAQADEYLRSLERRWGRGGIGDAIVVETAERCVLIDGGLWTKGRAVVLPYLKRRGVARLDAVILTHQHGDHYGGLAEILETVPANEFIANGLAHPAKAYRKLLETVKSSGARLRVVRGGETFDWGGGASATVVQGAGARGVSPDDYNNNSLVIRMTFGKTSFLFTGDCEDEEEKAILATRRDLRSQVLKVGHHGSSSSCTYPFLRAVRPEIAVVSIGEGNRFGLPHREVLDRLVSLDCTVYRTDLDGSVTVVSDGTRLSVETERRRPVSAVTGKPLKEEYYRLESEAKGLLRRKDYAGAAARYRKALLVEPGAASAHSALGYCLKKQGRETEAIKEFSAALAGDPCDSYANLHLGLILMRRDRPRALGCFEKYLDCHADTHWAGLAREKAGFLRARNGWELREEGREEEAIQELEKAVALAPGNAFAHFQLGLLYPPRDLEKARRAIARCLELEPEGRHAAEARLLAAELEADR